MLKLYRTKHGVTEYWEAWAESSTKVTIRWGRLGEKGETRSVSARTSSAKLIESESMPAWAAGFKPIMAELMAQIVIQYRIDGKGSKRDLDKEQVIEDLMNECLGWTGLGHCDGHDIGSGEMNIFCDVVDGPLSEQVILDCLRGNGQLEGAIVARRERVGDESYIVFRPKDFHGDFSLI